MTCTFAKADLAKRKRNQCSEIALFQKLLPRFPKGLTSSLACQMTQATFQQVKEKKKDPCKIRNEEFLHLEQLDKIFKCEIKKWYVQ